MGLDLLGLVGKKGTTRKFAEPEHFRLGKGLAPGKKPAPEGHASGVWWVWVVGAWWLWLGAVVVVVWVLGVGLLGVAVCWVPNPHLMFDEQNVFSTVAHCVLHSSCACGRGIGGGGGGGGALAATATAGGALSAATWCRVCTSRRDALQF